MTCTDVKRNTKMEMPARPRFGRIFKGMLLAVLLICIAVMVSQYLHNANIEQQIEIQQEYRDDMIAELERGEGTYDAQSIVLYNTSRAQAEELAEKLGASLRMTKDGKFATLTLPEGTTILDVYRNEENLPYIEQMSADWQVSISELTEGEGEEDGQDDTRLPMRPTYSVSDTDCELQTYLDYMNMQNVWASYTGYGVTVAVIDTGIDTDHPEFAGRISEYSYNATEDKIVKDYVLENGDYDWSLVEDEQGHGTAVTGVIAASINSGNVVGIAPEVNIITIKAECDEDGVFKRTSDLVFGLYYAIERDVSVINMSFSIIGMNPFADAAQLAYDSDVICVAAAGNYATAALTYPAADPLVIGVGALADGSWELAAYSNYGENVDVVAPGTTYTSLVDGKYGNMDGTSLACPAVTGLIALYMQNNPYVTFDRVTEELYASSYDLGDLGRDWYYGFGAVDANAFLIEERGTVTYDMLTDEVDDMKGTFIKGHALQELPEPDRLYAVFDGWYYDEHCTQRVEYYTDAFYGDLTLYASWVNEDDGIPFTYVILDDGTVEIRSYTGHRRFITVPEKIEGRVVSSIGDFAFAGETNLREVGLPSGLRHIGLNAFAGCYNLVSMYIPENVTEIEVGAFANCVRLSTVAFTGQSKLLTIGNFAFEGCGKLRTIELPATLQSVNGTAFKGTSALTSIRVQSGNQYFKSEDGVLFDISGETLVAYPAAHGTTYEIPESVKTVGIYAFYGSKVLFMDFGSTIKSIEDSAFESSSVLAAHIPDSVTFLGQKAFSKSAIKELTLGNGLTVIPMEAFAKCSSLRSVHIPEGIVEIRAAAFFACSHLQSLTFAENSRLLVIANLAFACCAITELHVPASVIMIGSAGEDTHEPYYYSDCNVVGAFDFAPLRSVTFAKGSQLSVIGDRAFAFTKLESIELPEGLTHLGAGAFWTTPLKTITLPASLTVLEEAVFGFLPKYGYSRLSSITVAKGNSVYHDVDGVVYNLENTEIHAFPAGRDGEYSALDTTRKIMPYSFAGTQRLEKVTLPEGLTEIGNYAFCYSGSYTYDLPSTLRYIKNGGFYSNFRLNSIELPEGLEQIAEYAFFDCGVLPTIHIPDSVLQIGRYAFAWDWSLASVTFSENAKLPRISFGAFAYCGLHSFRVPANVSTMAQKAFEGCPYLTEITFAGNSKLESISAYMFDGCSNLQTITFEAGSALTSVQAHGLEGMDKLTTINWGDAKVTNIDNFAFRFCESLSYLTLPETVTNVGRYAFYGCKSLSELTLPANVEHIGMFAFLGTGDLNLYFAADTMPAYLDEDWDHGIRGYYVGVTNVQTQGDYKYATLTSGDVSIIEYLGSDTELDLSVLDFGAPITAIGGSAFEDKGIVRVTLPDTLTSIQAEAFAYNPLCEITIPASVTFIGREAFTYTDISSLTFSEGSQIANIEQYAFEKTEKLTEVTLPASLTTMGRGVFQESGLNTVNFEEGIKLERIPENAFAETKLQSITLPDSVNYIDHNAFMEIPTLQSVTFGNAESISLQSNSFYHTGLVSLHIPANVTYIGEYSFVALTSLTEITVDENNPWYKSEDGLLLSKDGRKLIVVPAGRTGSLTVPASVEMLGFGAFEETKLSEVRFDPNANILTLGYRAFFKANNITSIDIPKSVISIDYYAFAYCENLHTVNFAEDNQLKGIYEGAFLGDINLENITIPESIVEISDFAFYGCSKIDRIPTGASSVLKGIYSYAFAYTGIEGEFTTPETLIDIGDYAFLGTKITKLTVPDTNQWDLIIGIGAFEDCYMLEEATLPFIGASLDDMNYSWFGYIFGAGDYEANATYVPASLKTVTITEGQTLVGFGGFAYLTSIEILNLPHSICVLYNDAFKSVTAPYEFTNPIMVWWDDPEDYPVIYYPYVKRGHFGPGLTEQLELAGPIVLSNSTWTDGVTFIEYYAFENCIGLTSITIPDSVTELGTSVFSGCTGLKTAVLPSHLTRIPSEFFYGCSSLSDIHIPKTVTRIESGAFSGCSSLTEIVLPAGVTEIFESAFNVCRGLERFIIDGESSVYSVYDRVLYKKDSSEIVCVPEGIQGEVKLAEGITELTGEHFSCHAFVTNVVIPDTVDTIGEGAFNECTSLKSIVIPESVEYIGRSAFQYCLNLTDVVIGDQVRTIDEYAFYGCSSLMRITLGKSLTSIGEYAFYDCNNLQQIMNNSSLDLSLDDSARYDFGGILQYARSIIDKDGNVYYRDNQEISFMETSEGLLFIKQDGFYTLVAYTGDQDTVTFPESVNGQDYEIYQFRGAKHVILPDSMDHIGLRAFAECNELQSIQIPDSVTEISKEAFSYCRNLSSIILPDSVCSLGDSVFYHCDALEYVNIPNQVTVIPEHAFGYCTSMKSIDLPDSIVSIENFAFSGSALETLILPDSVRYIGTEAFGYNKALKKVTLSQNLERIPMMMFNGCSSIEHIEIPESVTEIGLGAFQHCRALKEIKLPENVEYIDHQAFYGCLSLQSVTIGAKAKSIGNRAFYNCAAMTDIRIPDSLMHIGDYAFDGCTALTEIKIPDSVTYLGTNAFPKDIVLNFEGDHPQFAVLDGILYDYPITRIIQVLDSSIIAVSVPDGITCISWEAFKDCSKLQKVILPDSITRIESYAFENCESLKEIEIPDTVVYFGEYTFKNCDSLTSFTFPDDAEILGHIFTGCDALKEVILPKTMTYLPMSVFEGCSSLESVSIPDGYTMIELSAFASCTALKHVSIPESVTAICPAAFSGCVSLEMSKIPDGVTYIGERAFAGCLSIASIELPESLTQIGDNAFSGITSITIPENVQQIGFNAFGSELSKIVNLSELDLQIGSMEYGGVAKDIDILIDRDGNITYRDWSEGYFITKEGFIYSIEETGYVLRAYCGDQDPVTLPEYIDGQRYSISMSRSAASHVIVPGTCKEFVFTAPSIKHITFCEGVGEIGHATLSYCVGLITVQIPSTVTVIDEGFLNCLKLEQINVSPNNSVYTSKDGVLYSKNCTTLIKVPHALSGKFVVPESVTEIDQDAFWNARKLTEIVIVTNVSSVHLDYCTALTRIHLPDQLEELRISGCSALSEINIPDGVNELSIQYCEAIDSIVIPVSVTVIGDHAFAGCTSLIDISIPSSVKRVGKGAFDATGYYNDPDNWHNGLLTIDDWLIAVDPDVEYFDTTGLKGAAKNAYSDCHLLKNVIWNSSVEGATNIETIFVKDIENNLPFNHPDYPETWLPVTVKNIVITSDVDLTELRYNPEMFKYVTGVTIYVEGNEKDLRWDDNFPGWNYGNRVVYGDDWSWVTFYDEQGNIISMEPRRDVQIIRKPVLQDQEDAINTYVLTGWDIDGDGIADSVPATTVTDLEAHPVYTVIPKEYTVTFKDSETGEIYKQETLHYGDAIIPPETPTRENSFLVGWRGYTDGMTVTGNLEFVTNWHVHDMGEWYQTIAPACTTEGENRRDCSGCDYHETEVLPALGHTESDAVEENRTELTCTEVGGYDMVVYCAACGNELSREHTEIEALGHVMGEWYEAIAPACTTDGENRRDCGRCDYYEATTIPALGHTESDAVEENRTEPTCTEVGGYDMVVYCAACGNELSREHTEIPANGHTSADAVVENRIEPTCTVDGTYDSVAYCTACGIELSRETNVILATGHSHEAIVTAPTCTEQGYTTHTCRCSDAYVDSYVDALGHTEVIDAAVAPTCIATGLTEGKHCSVCNEVLVAQEVVPANGHAYESIVIAPTCTEQGYTMHTCRCGDSYLDSEVDSLGHTPGDWIVDAEPAIGVAGSKHKECTACGEILQTEVIEPLPEETETETETEIETDDAGSSSSTESNVESTAPDSEIISESEPGSEKTSSCNGSISTCTVLLALLGCFAVIWRPRKDN